MSHAFIVPVKTIPEPSPSCGMKMVVMPKDATQKNGPRDKFLSEIRQWPTNPGIYIMKDPTGRPIYVGKAKNLRNRISSYFQKAEGLSPKTRVLVKKISSLEFTVTSTELEALLLECNLIKQHRPRYNVRLKDDKNYPYIVLDFTHPFPQFRVSRKVVVDPKLRYFGPFSGSIREISRFLLKTFQIRDCSDAKFKNRARPCLNYEIGTCTAPCVDYVSQENYADQIQKAILFLRGKKQELVRGFKIDMDRASDALEYEKARAIRDKIFSIEKITEKQGAILTDKQKDIDVVGVFAGESEFMVVVLFIRNGFLIGRRSEKIATSVDSPEETIRKFLQQFYLISLIPEEVWLATDIPDREILEQALTVQAKREVRIRVPRTEKPMRLLGMAYENAKLIYQDLKAKVPVSASQLLQKALDLAEPPQTIEGIDVSNLQGKHPAIALVHFSDERPLKSRYRLYYPKTVEGQNDFAMIYEVVHRRLSNQENPLPDVLLIDGGKGQLASAVRARDELGIELPIISIAKARTQSAFSRKEVERSEERIFVPNRKNHLNFKENDPALLLLQRVRDEAHRFSVVSHRARRKKEMLSASPLTDLAGIGDKTREKLLKRFGSMDAIGSASPRELSDLGLTRLQIANLQKLGDRGEE